MKYINYIELTEEIILSKEAGELTYRAIELIKEIAKIKIAKYKYSDKKLFESLAVKDVILKKHWIKFNPEKSDNAYGYISQLIGCFAASYNRKKYFKRKEKE